MSEPGSLPKAADGELERSIRAAAGAEADALARFARSLFARDGEPYAAELGLDDRRALVTSAYRFFATFTAPIHCRVRTPKRAADGWDSPYTILETHLTDRPFIVDTIRELLHERGLAVRYLLHPIFAVERDAAGALVGLRPLDGALPRESFVHCVIDHIADAEAAELESALAERLGDVYWATEDYRRMRERLTAARGELGVWPRQSPAAVSVEEARELLDWLVDGNFVFLGAGTFRWETNGDPPVLRLDRESALGILQNEKRALEIAERDLRRERAVIGEPQAFAVLRSAVEATVHRAALMHVVVLRQFDPARQSSVEQRFFGLFTSKAYAESSAEVPVLRRKLRQILAAEHVVADSYDFREIESIFDAMPKAELFMLSAEQIRSEIRGVRERMTADTVRVRLRAHGDGTWVTVILPRDRFSGEIRQAIEALLTERLGGPVVDHQVALGEGEQARLHFYVAARTEPGDRKAEEIEKRIAERVRSWDDRLRERLLAEYRGARGRELAARYTALFTPEYRATTEVAEAIGDIRHIEALSAPGAIEIELANASGADAERFNVLKLYLRGAGLVLSDFLPLLENLGLRVFADDTVALGEEDERIVLHRFRVQDRSGNRLDVHSVAPRLAPALLEIHAGRASNDSLNRLILEGGLGWREVDLLRIYRNLAFQAGGGPSRPALNDVLLAHPAAAQAVFELFAARFDPALGDREAPSRSARERFAAALEAVETAGEDRMLRNYLALVDGTVRTNYFRPQRADHPYLSVKIHSQAVEFLPKPRPLYEIYVHSARMEGIHLRGGRVARGGIRWSDRADDFRTEVLGLMKTQMVKNAVIVPVGSKGGFVVKRARAGEEGAAEVRECYSTLMRGMLEVTDNIVRGELVPPSGVVRYDGDDPYLVVAADKGTAAFSDLANAIAAELQFWLGDAFASGGSHGYDHKKEGITARGAWECVHRHFRELGKDIQAEPFDVAGIGDMSGDVFGNGMLLSRKIRLRAAFNHAHIFLDPTPDPETSFRERERLFRLPRSAWTDYDRTRLSPGGMIVARNAKAAPLSPEVRALLGVESDRLDGEGLIRAILGAKTELLWNGGIGTYVRASGETNADVGDHASDAVRRSATEIGAAVVGEGGNLGFTQRARIEYALRDGRINTDAIDNSGGVDLSDHEVNLKILFQPLIEAGKLTLAHRNRLLDEVKPDVVEHVLSHNARQALLLSLDQRRSATRLVEFRDQMTQLEQEGPLDRALEALPDREALRLRRGTFRGLTRPELAVLTAYSKLQLQRQLIASPWIEAPAFERYLFAYFPRRIAERFPDALRAHRLRREIIAAELANQVIDRMGLGFTQRMQRDSAADAPTAVASFVAVVAITEADRVFDAIGVSRIPAEEAYALGLRWEASVESACKLLVGSLRGPGALGGRLESWRRALGALADVGETGADEAPDREAARLEQLGLDSGVARSLRALERLRSELEIVRVAEDRDLPLADVAAVYAELTTIIDFAVLEQWFTSVPGDDRWEKRAAEGLHDDLAAARRRLTSTALARSQPASNGVQSVVEKLRAFAAEHESEIGRLRTLIEDFASRRQISIAAMVVVVRELWKLAGRG